MPRHQLRIEDRSGGAEKKILRQYRAFALKKHVRRTFSKHTGLINVEKNFIDNRRRIFGLDFLRTGEALRYLSFLSSWMENNSMENLYEDTIMKPAALAESGSEKGTEPSELTWEFKMPLLTNRFMLYDMVKILGWSYVIVMGLLSVLFLIQGDMKVLLPLFGLFGCLILAVAFLMIFVMGVIFGNRFEYRYSVTLRGFSQATLSRRSRFLNRMAVIAGLFGGNMRTVGAGMIAISQETIGESWESIYRIKEYPELGVITLMNSWRVITRLYCTMEDYSRVAQLVRESVAKAEEIRERAPRERSSSPSLLKRSGVVLLSCCLITTIPYPFEIKWTALAVAALGLLLAVWAPVFRRIGAAAACLAALYHFLVIGLRGATIEQLVPDSVLQGQSPPAWSSYRLWSFLDAAGWIRFGLSVCGLGLLLFVGIRMLSGTPFRKR